MSTSSLDIDRNRWPDLARVPSGPRARISAGVARGLVRAATERLGITLTHPGEPAVAPDGPQLRVHRPQELYARIGRDGLIGFGEAYLTGAWDSDDVAGTLSVLATELDTLVPDWMQRLRGMYVARPPRRQRSTAENARHNISAHYDLSNEMFALFLDPSLTYSSALFDTDERPGDHAGHRVAGPPERDGDLLAAQHRKIDRLLDRARVGPGSRVVEIGTGWGELAIRAAARGAGVRSITLSGEQQQLARQRIAKAGHSEAVTVELLDYRSLEGQYDAVLSVEMIEAVGYQFWPEYFRTVERLLAPGGVAAIQAITMPHERMLATRNTRTWITKYIFPGGIIPSVEAIEQVTALHTGLRVSGRLSFGSHYAETLRQWDARFRATRAERAALGFDEIFDRMWHFYLEYSRAGFLSGYLDVQQLVLERDG